MEEKGYWDMNWTALFVVTACSTFIFSVIIKILDGYFSTFLLVIAAITTILSLLSWFLNTLSQQYSRKKDGSRYTTDLSSD